MLCIPGICILDRHEFSCNYYYLSIEFSVLVLAISDLSAAIAGWLAIKTRSWGAANWNWNWNWNWGSRGTDLQLGLRNCN